VDLEIAVLGQGYVGLPLAISAAEAGYKVTGIDSDEDKVSTVSNGFSKTEDVSNERLVKQLNSGHYYISNDFSLVRDCSIVLICVPTPLDKYQKPDLSALHDVVSRFASHLSPGTLIILESTVGTGTTRNILLPKIKTKIGFDVNQLDLAYSPERIDPSNKKWNLVNTPKIVSGINMKSLQRAAKFYAKFVNSIVECESIEIAETAKLLENSFRLVNISFINEISKFCYRLGLDVNKVIAAATTKPYGFMPFYPSIGVGGHCIPVDPIYLLDKSEEVGESSKLIKLAAEINLTMPVHFIDRAEVLLSGLKGKKILVIGISYKPNIADTRQTSAELLINGLRQRFAHVDWHDDLVKEWKGEKSVPLSRGYDLAILVTPHDYLDLRDLVDVPILNTRESI